MESALSRVHVIANNNYNPRRDSLPGNRACLTAFTGAVRTSGKLLTNLKLSHIDIRCTYKGLPIWDDDAKSTLETQVLPRELN